MSRKSKRMRREAKTLEAMVHLYCAGHHGPREGLCPACAELLAYALERLARCPFQEAKTACAKCTVHCYRPAMRERARAVMRYSGPRMLARHPVLAVLHLFDGLRNPPRAPSSSGRRD